MIVKTSFPPFFSFCYFFVEPKKNLFQKDSSKETMADNNNNNNNNTTEPPTDPPTLDEMLASLPPEGDEAYMRADICGEFKKRYFFFFFFFFDLFRSMV